MPPPPLRPFPFTALSIGTDIAHVPRIARLVASPRTRPRFLRKVLTSREERDFHLRFSSELQARGGRNNTHGGALPWRSAGAVDWVKSGGDAAAAEGKRGGGDGDGEHARWVERAAKFLAGRWAAKEAVVKACSWRRLMFDEIVVLREEGGKRVYGVILDEREVREKRDYDSVGEGEPAGQVVQLSISHDGEYATAVCLAADETRSL
jgi:holo-[acyl-carrier protein] synthase